LALLPIAIVVAVWNPCDTVPSVAVGDSMVSIGLNLAVLVCTALGAACRAQVVPRDSIAKRPPSRWSSMEVALLGCVVAFWFWLALATWGAIGRSNARFAINGFWQWVSLLGIAASVATLARRHGMVRRCSILILAVLAGITAYGWLEYAWIQPDMRAELARDPVGALQRRGIVADSAEALLIKNRIESTEMRGVFALANSLAGVLVVAWVLFVGWTFTAWQSLDATSTRNAPGMQGLSSDSSRARRFHSASAWALMAMTLSIGVALLVTKSRTAWIAAILASPCVWLLHPSVRGHARRWLWLQRGWIAAAAALCVGVVLTVYWLDPLIIREAPKSLAYRMDYWRGAWELIAERPALGYGPLNYQATYLRVKLPTAAESPADPHNAPLEIAHAGGWPLLMLVIAFVVIAVLLARRRMRHVSDGESWEPASRSVAEATTSSADRPGSPASPVVAISHATAPRGDGWAFWSGAIVAALGVFLWSFFRAGDLELGAASVSLVVAVALVLACTRWEPARRAIAHWLESDLTVFAIAIGAFGIHLLASGGWMLPGTMTIPMVLLGLWLSDAMTGKHGPVAGDATGAQGLRYAGAWMAAGTMAALWGLWWWTMFSPVTQSLRQQFEWAQSPGAGAPERIVSEVQVDPYDAEIARVALELATSRFERTGASDARKQWAEAFLRLREAFLARDPGHGLALSEVGQKELRMAAALPDAGLQQVWLHRAAEDLAAAVDAYPASANACLQAAVACGLAGRSEDMQRFFQAADRIDAATPHRDRKIQAVQIFWPKRLERTGGFALLPPLEAAARRGIPEDFVRGEPVAEVLRSQPLPNVRN
jgi:O-antigen ligase